jgi:hypothetical protein
MTNVVREMPGGTHGIPSREVALMQYQPGCVPETKKRKDSDNSEHFLIYIDI